MSLQKDPIIMDDWSDVKEWSKQNAEKAAQVHKAADNEAKSTGINDEGHQGGTSYGNGKRKNQEQSEENQASSKKTGEIRESYLGIHIDITR
jgi:hypothetical protein